MAFQVHRVRVPVADGVRARQHRDGRHRRHREEEVDGHLQFDSRHQGRSHRTEGRNYRPRSESWDQSYKITNIEL